MSVEYNVISSFDGTWRVLRRGAGRAATEHSTQSEAVVKARELAKKGEGGTVVVHRVDGTVSRITTYGKNPYIRREHSVEEVASNPKAFSRATYGKESTEEFRHKCIHQLSA